MTEEQIAVLGHAFFDGKTLEYKIGNQWVLWVESYCPNFVASKAEWRIKPEEKQKEIWCTYKTDGGTIWTVVKGSKHHESILDGEDLTHIPSLDREVELP